MAMEDLEMRYDGDESFFSVAIRESDAYFSFNDKPEGLMEFYYKWLPNLRRCVENKDISNNPKIIKEVASILTSYTVESELCCNGRPTSEAMKTIRYNYDSYKPELSLVESEGV